MSNDTKAFLYNVNVMGLGSEFIDRGIGDKYYEYESKNFFGAVIRSHEPLMRIDGEDQVMVIHTRYTDGKFCGVNIDIIPPDHSRVDKYDIKPKRIPLVDLQIRNNPGNIVINDTESLTSLFFHDHQNRKTTIINVVKK